MFNNTMSKAAAALIQSVACNSGSTPPNGPSKTGNPSGGGRGNNPPKGK